MCLHLWRLCRQVDSLRLRDSDGLQRSGLRDLVDRVRDLAFASRRGGAAAYGSLCLHLAERIEDLNEEGGLPRTALLWLDLWADRSLRYLSEPGAASALTLLEQLNDPLWRSPFSRTEQALLVHAMAQIDKYRPRGVSQI